MAITPKVTYLAIFLLMSLFASTATCNSNQGSETLERSDFCFSYD